MKKISVLFALTLVVVLFVVAGMLVGCVPTTTEKVSDKLINAGYSVTAIENDDVALQSFQYSFSLSSPDYASGITAAVYGTKQYEEEEKDPDSVTVLFFDSKEDAFGFYTDVKDAHEKASEDSEEKEDWEIRRAGNIVYFGTEAGLRAANK